MKTIKCCPNCGGEAETYKRTGYMAVDTIPRYNVGCPNCKISVYSYVSLKEAIDEWNKGENYKYML